MVQPVVKVTVGRSAGNGSGTGSGSGVHPHDGNSFTSGAGQSAACT